MVTNNQELRVKVYGATLLSEQTDILEDVGKLKQQPPGHIYIKDGQMFAHTEDTPICILEIQLPGKRKMLVKDLLNGYKLSKNSKMR